MKYLHSDKNVMEKNEKVENQKDACFAWKHGNKAFT